MTMTLDVTAKQEVSYAVQLWQRDAQIAHAIQRVKGRIQGHPARGGKCAVVCFGPSLTDTWEAIKDFQYVITCSGSHKFLVERGFVPNALRPYRHGVERWWHVEVDPRAHKVTLMGQPQLGVEYLISSTCHKAVFDHLEGYDVKLWHVFDSQAEGFRVLPPDEWAITGGCSVGLRAMGIAAFLGFRDVHVFGMDGCEGKTGKHAAEHPNQPKDSTPCPYGGVEYRTTPAMLEAARQTFHELDQMSDVNVTFHGEGLVQHMARDYVKKPNNTMMSNVVGIMKPATISAEYRELNAQLHRDNLAYGVGGGKHAEVVLKLAESINARSVLDYGCGKGELAKALPFGICEYDPAIPGKEASPRPADLVACTDVLEHIEPDRLHFVLNDLARCTRKVGFLTIHTGPAAKSYADGRNAHLIQKPQSWWEKKLQRYFQVGRIIKKGPELYVIVGPKLQQKKAA